ncbi:hypothetical protein EBI00_13425 [Marinomonas hwangdonensis]|uniref:Uncharacterized protein n=2 Tax=Marinomonas hwangdonensis TaxID=1053647 RepID=A0A3M8Q1I7_9GAMM|nr:hypothetical protein EBI00_13425 [Marinomonas hwangdonensis]
MLYACVSLCVVLVAVWMVCRPVIKVGIDDQGAYLFDDRYFFRLVFVRANGFQLIAKVETEQASWWHYVLPPYRVIYCDNLPKSSYRRLRSFAAQQILLRRSEDAKKRFNV